MAEKKDLSKLSKQELVEMLQRQEKILANRRFLQSLPDKGMKVSQMVEKIKESIAARENLENTVSQLERLTLSQSQRTRVGAFLKSDFDGGSDNGDDDDDEEIQMAVYNNEEEQMTTNHKDERSGSNDTSKSSFLREQQAKGIKMGQLNKQSHNPGKCTEKQKQSYTGNKINVCATSKVWDYESSVTPRSYKFQEARPLSLQESFKLLQHQEKRLKELQAEHAVKKLQENQRPFACSSDPVLPVTYQTGYREKNLPVDDYESDGTEEDEPHVMTNETDGDDDDNG